MNNLRKISLIGVMLFGTGQEIKPCLLESVSMFKHPQTGQIILNFGECHSGPISGIVDLNKRQLVEYHKRLFLDLFQRLHKASILLELNCDDSLFISCGLRGMPDGNRPLTTSLVGRYLSSLSRKRELEKKGDFAAISTIRGQEDSNVKLVFADGRTDCMKNLICYSNFNYFNLMLKGMASSASGRALLGDCFIASGGVVILDGELKFEVQH